MRRSKQPYRFYRLRLNVSLGLLGTEFRTDGRIVEYRATPDSGGCVMWGLAPTFTRPEQLNSNLFVEIV
jgi:hypothetical protein